ncbi:MAG: helix-turn-helix transcriptional regulator [Clostridia bacterium]|nr:helix-turn-helix transcriptional regulator [Clostridia bacterium]
MKIYDFNGKKNICGQRIKDARKVQKVSQSMLAARLQTLGVNIERDSISRIEIGTRFVADFELVALCKALNVTPEYLLGMDEQ